MEYKKAHFFSLPGQKYRGTFHILSINVSVSTGVRKTPVEEAEFRVGFGVVGDAHGGLKEDRQVSLLAWEDIEKAMDSLVQYEKAGLHCTKVVENEISGISRETILEIPRTEKSFFQNSPLPVELKPGDFAENLTTRGIVLAELPLGARLIIGSVVLEVSKIGKECHAACEIRRLVGDCIMPRRGIFARVLKGGTIHRDDSGTYYF
ncbi:MAG: hypothetical protein N2Z76_00250 [Treponemataceae bacterium]|nr:hypothetical protein [Treponemataceae bacterium]